MNRWRKLGVAALVIGGLGGLGVGGVTDATSAPPSTTPPSSASSEASTAPAATGTRLQALCARVPRLLARTNRLVERLEGDADTRGSLARLQERIDAATAAGRDAQVTVLTNRLHVRRAQLALLRDRRALLLELAAACEENAA